MPQPTNHRINSTRRGESLASAGTPFAVTNSNTHQANGSDIRAILNGDGGTNHTNLTPLGCDGRGLYANIYFIWMGTVPTRPTIRVYGQLPPATEGGTRRYPWDADDGFPNVSDIWVPLIEPDETNNHMLFSSLSALTDSTMSISRPRYVYLQGCMKIITTVITASSGTGRGIIGVSFSG